MPIAIDDRKKFLEITIDRDEVRAELSRIFSAAGFRTSKRRRSLLEYLVEETLAGRGHLLKGYSVGVSVFGRREDFDARADPVVRLEAHRLRRDLANYYATEGSGNPLRITIPKGHYVPEVMRAAEPAPPPTARPDPVGDRQRIVAGDAAWPDGAANDAEAPSRPARFSLPVRLAALLVVLVALGGLFFIASRVMTPARPVAEAPKLLIVPFEAIGSRREDGFLAAGISDQIVTDLTRFPDFQLYVPGPRGADAGEDAFALARGLGIPYALTGSVSSDGSAVRIGGRLVEIATGRILWAGDYDRPFDSGSLLAVQGQIAAAIASTLGQPYGVVKTDITGRLSPGLAPSMPSYECVLRAYAYRRNFDRSVHAPLMACLQEAVRRDPSYPDAWAMLGWLQLDAGRFGIAADRDGAYADALASASHAVALDADSIVALKALASIDHYRGDFAESERVQRRALALNPNDPDTLAQLGWRLAVRGRFEEGIPYLEQAIQRTVNPPGWYFHLLAIDHYLDGRYQDMLSVAKRGTAGESGVGWSLVAIAYGALGNVEAGRDALAKMAAAAPRLAADPAAVYRGHQAVEPIVTALVGGLRKAGWSPPPGASPSEGGTGSREGNATVN